MGRFAEIEIKNQNEMLKSIIKPKLIINWDNKRLCFPHQNHTMNHFSNLSKFIIYERSHCEILLDFVEDKLELLHMNTDSFVFSYNPLEGLIDDSKLFFIDLYLSD